GVAAVIAFTWLERVTPAGIAGPIPGALEEPRAQQSERKGAADEQCRVASGELLCFIEQFTDVFLAQRVRESFELPRGRVDLLRDQLVLLIPQVLRALSHGLHHAPFSV